MPFPGIFGDSSTLGRATPHTNRPAVTLGSNATVDEMTCRRTVMVDKLTLSTSYRVDKISLSTSRRSDLLVVDQGTETSLR